ncbi:glycosyltransferase [Corynebacterium sp.]|uniref:glycosyltransferase family 2 protein n=1 Tax=Corynebacterium sp. TaxID=1720 RepID=UPI001D1B8BF1|nr:glycosyltransferase [Corynebacterium sp.]MBS5996371.1 glycosyltransferase [Corynebacterium sp.]
MTDISVVIGFRDWGALRLELALESVRQSFGQFDGEVILSDFGSTDHESNRELAQRLDVKYVFTPDKGYWSRSEALNAGFVHADGDILVSTDADMVFTPKSFERITAIAKLDGKSAYFLQCRDLPEGMDDNWVAAHPHNWKQMERASRLRPRWGMGGMMAIPREGFDLIRGFDERLHTYGGEDLDFAQRARRAGYRTVWIDDPEVRMYHMWHPKTINTVNQTDEGREAVRFNRSVVHHDKSFVRNTSEWKHRRGGENPVVSVAISTYNRADFLRETILSVLNQTMQDFEIVIVDDGGTDHTKQVVDDFNDSRIKYFWQENQGISAARNLAAEKSTGFYTAVIDDDDLMHPNRLQWQLEGIEAGAVGNVGCFINFEHDNGTMQLFVGKNPTAERSIPTGSAPGHGTWMLQTDVIRKLKYDPSLSSGVDNNFFLRLLRSGYKVTHTGKPVTLRRMHPSQVTNTDVGNQTRAAAETLNFLRWRYDGAQRKIAEERANATPQWPKIGDKQEMLEEARRFLPDHLITRNLIVTSPLPQTEWTGQVASTQVHLLQSEGSDSEEIVTDVSIILAASYEDMVTLRQNGAEFRVDVANDEAPSDPLNVLANGIIPSLSTSEHDAVYALFVQSPSEDKFNVFVGDHNSISAKLDALSDKANAFVVGPKHFEADNEV